MNRRQELLSRSPSRRRDDAGRRSRSPTPATVPAAMLDGRHVPSGRGHLLRWWVILPLLAACGGGRSGPSVDRPGPAPEQTFAAGMEIICDVCPAEGRRRFPPGGFVTGIGQPDNEAFVRYARGIQTCMLERPRNPDARRFAARLKPAALTPDDRWEILEAGRKQAGLTTCSAQDMVEVLSHVLWPGETDQPQEDRDQPQEEPAPFALHEMPESVRIRVRGEMARVIGPGGQVVAIDQALARASR